MADVDVKPCIPFDNVIERYMRHIDGMSGQIYRRCLRYELDVATPVRNQEILIETLVCSTQNLSVSVEQYVRIYFLR